MKLSVFGVVIFLITILAFSGCTNENPTGQTALQANGIESVKSMSQDQPEVTKTSAVTNESQAEANSESTPDPCANVTCSDKCDGTTRYYNGKCDTSTTECQYSIQQNSKECGYEEPKEKTANIGEPIKVDDLTYKVTKAESFTEMGCEFLKETTSGKFVKIYLEITNNANKSQYIFTPRLTLIDSKNREYDPYAMSSMYITDGINFGEQLQPGLTLSGAEVFELAKDSTGLKLEIRGDWLSITKVTINISQVKDIGKDTTRQDEIDKQWNEAMENSEKKMEELMNQCNAPFKCTSNCPEYMGLGQKDCSLGQVCCLQT